MIVTFTVSETHDDILINVRDDSFSVTINTSTVYNFDRCGRLLGAYRGGRNYLRGLDNRVLVKWGAGHGLAQRSRCDLDESEKRAFFGDMTSKLATIGSAMRRGGIRLQQPGASPETLTMAAAALDTALGYDALAAEGRVFSRIYKPISILPPDQYLALVLQATEGCSWNRCTFCDFYRDRPFHVNSEVEFRAHVGAVLGFLGEGVRLRRSVFLADANALVISQARLLRLLDVVHEHVRVMPPDLDAEARKQWLATHSPALRGVYSFVDAFTTRHKGEADYREMAQRSLRRVYIGLESGDSDLLGFVHKGSTAADACEAVRTIKAAGVDVGVILMLGAGGRSYSAGHVQHSIAALNVMGLGERDILYFSPFMDFPGSEYSRRAAEMGIEPLTGAEMDEQMAAIRNGLQFADAQHPPKIAIYDIREFIY